MESNKEKEFLHGLQFAIMFVIVLLAAFLLLSESYKYLNINLPFGISKLNTFFQKTNVFLEKKFLGSCILIVLVLYAIQVPSKIRLKSSKAEANFWLLLGLGSFLVLVFIPNGFLGSIMYVGIIFLCLVCMILGMINGGIIFNSLVEVPKTDLFNEYNEQFPQNGEILENDLSVTYQYQYKYQDNWKVGYANVVSPDRAVIVIGGQGAGKTFTIFTPAIFQMMGKGYSFFCYDFASPDLSLVIFNAYIEALKHNKYTFGKKENGEPILPQFNVINFEDLNVSSRCNPFAEKYMDNIDECFEKCKTLLNNLNRSWIAKEGDFWAISAYNLLTCCIWFLRLMNGRYNQFLSKNAEKIKEKYEPVDICTLPHAIALLTMDIKTLIDAMDTYPELHAYTNMFSQGLENQAGSQIAGQVASTQAALAPLSSPNIAWVMSGDDMDLSINSDDEPRIICAANYGQKASIYGAALSIYTSTVMKMSYEHRKRKFALILDELPTMYVMKLDTYITTIRKHKGCVWMGMQDFEQLSQIYTKTGAEVIMNTSGSLFSGLTNGATAKKISEYFGKTEQQSFSTNFNKGEVSVGHSSRAQDLLPAAKIMNLSQGQFVGKVADTFAQPIKQKLFSGFFNVPPMRQDIKELPKKRNLSKEEIKNMINDNAVKIRKDIGLLKVYLESEFIEEEKN